MTSPHTPDPTGATGPRPDAGQRTDLPAVPVSEQSYRGGLLRVGTRVQVTYPDGDGVAYTIGPIVDAAAVPAPYLSVERDSGPNAGQRVVVFTGPGVTVEPAPPDHPGLQ